MRERSTWNRDEVMTKAAGLKTAGHEKQADPYTMNQDHPQPAADKYVTGDPSTFAEDVHTPNTWDVEYKGDEVKRDEIGMADYRPDTFNHSEKTAREVLLKKAQLSVAVARLMLAGQKTASLKAVEDQAFALMYMPDEALISTHKRLANEQDQGDEGQQQKQAQQDDKKEADGQQQQDKQAQQDDKKEAEGQQQQDKQAQAQQDDKKEAEGQQQDKQAEDQNAKANKNWPTEKTAALVKQVVASLQSGNFKNAQEQIQQLVQQQAQGQQQVMSQEQLQAQIQQMIQQAMGQGQQQMPAQAQQQMPMQQQVQVSDEQVLDQMLAQDSCGPMAEVDIQMDPAQMDVMAGELGPEDEALRTLFAQDDEGQQDQGGEQQKQAGMSRTASTRTVGTRPSAGVAKLGGAGATGGAGTDLSSLWQSAPDVRDVFGM